MVTVQMKVVNMRIAPPSYANRNGATTGGALAMRGGLCGRVHAILQSQLPLPRAAEARRRRESQPAAPRYYPRAVMLFGVQACLTDNRPRPSAGALLVEADR